MSKDFCINDLYRIGKKLEEKTVEIPTLATVKEFEEFNKSIPKFPVDIKSNNSKSEQQNG